MDMDPHTPKAVWGFNGTERPGAVYLAAVLAGHNQKGLPAFSIYGHDVQDATDTSIPRDVKDKLLQYKSQGVSLVVFGDIFLEDLRKYRENNLAQVGMKGIFPIWKRDTAELAHTFIDLDFKAVIICVDSQSLEGKFAGRYFDNEFLSELPPKVDPCGENGEFHTFVFEGPIFQKPIYFLVGEKVMRDGFCFCDLLPV
jgi:uncharacterized protein (TIGR00290 family)